MPRARANPDQVLQTGRLMYGDNGTNQLPIKVDSNGNIVVGAGTASISKTVQTEIMGIRTIAASAVIASTILSLIGAKQATFFIDHGRGSTVNFAGTGTNYLLQASEKAAGNDTWRTLATFNADSTACSSALSSGAYGLAATVITILSGTAFVANDMVLIADTTSVTASEWVRVVLPTGTASFTILDGLNAAHASTEAMYNKAEHFTVTVDVGSLTRARVVVNNNASGTNQPIYSRVAVITGV
jgi:hypothetical protein